MDRQNRQPNDSNAKNDNQQANDPLSQLNQFHQMSQPNQSGEKNNGKDPQQKPLQKWTDQIKSWWSKLKQLPIVEKLKEHQKWLWISGGAIVACFLLLIMVLAFSDSSDLVQDFEKAMLEEDKETLKDLLVSDHSELEIDDAFVTKLIQQGKEDDDFLSDSVLMMNAQKNIYEEKELEVNVLMAEKDMTKQEILNEGNIYLKENKSFFGPDYVISVRPAYIKITSSTEPTQITLDGKPIQLKNGSTEQLVGPILPGKYKVVANKKYPFSEVIDEEEVNLFEKKRTVSIDFDLKGETVTFKSSIKGTELFINNKATGKKVGESGTEFGPVSTNGKLKAYGQFQFPWGTSKSNPVPVESEYGGIDITPNPFSNAKTKNEIIKVINNYAKEVVEVQKKRDGNLFTTLDEEAKKDWVNDMADKREYHSKSSYKGEAVKTVIAINRATITHGKNADIYKIKVPVQFHRREREYNQFDDGNEPLEEKISDHYTWLTYNNNEKKWEISGLNPIFFGQDIFKDPSVVTTDL